MVNLAFGTIGRATYICTGTANVQPAPLSGPSRVPYGLSGIMAFSFRFLAPTVEPVWQRGEQNSFGTWAEAGIELLEGKPAPVSAGHGFSASVGKLPRNPHHQCDVFGTSHLTSSHSVISLSEWSRFIPVALATTLMKDVAGMLRTDQGFPGVGWQGMVAWRRAVIVCLWRHVVPPVPFRVPVA